jgi:hypothetical protein
MRCWQAFFAVLLFVAGCGPKEPYPVPVEGTIALDGKPLAEGTISFITPGKVPEIVDVKAGRFAGKVKWGERRVEIAAYRPYQIPPEAPKHLHELMKSGKENYLPQRYHRQSTLTAQVKESGDNTYKFELTSD